MDVIAKLPGDFDQKLEEKKWTERRDALQALLDLLTSNPRLDPKANYGQLVDNLRKVRSIALSLLDSIKFVGVI